MNFNGIGLAICIVLVLCAAAYWAWLNNEMDKRTLAREAQQREEEELVEYVKAESSRRREAWKLACDERARRRAESMPVETTFERYMEVVREEAERKLREPRDPTLAEILRKHPQGRRV